MDSVKVQFDIKNNAQDLQDFILDLKGWESEMKRKDATLSESANVEETNYPPPRNKIKKKTNNTEKNNTSISEPISAYDYSSWDKFDVEKACKEVDEEEISKDEEAAKEVVCKPEKEVITPTTTKTEIIDQAFYEKYLGNRFVKQGKWDEAIKCYTKAIACDPSNAVFYANRGLCFLKIKNFKASETDSTAAIQLDPTYVKAFQRRALARSIMGQLEEAKADYNQILKLEPKNSQALSEIDKIQKQLDGHLTPVVKPQTKKQTFDPKAIFNNKPSHEEICATVAKSAEKPSGSDSTIRKEILPVTSLPSVNKGKNESKKKNTGHDVDKCNNIKAPTNPVDKQDDVNSSNKIHIVHPIKKAPHLRSKKPLKRILIETTDLEHITDTKVQDSVIPDIQPTQPPETSVSAISTSVPDEGNSESSEIPDIPKTSVQFHNSWKKVKNSLESSYLFLKKISAESLPLIFQNSMESDIFSGIINVLATEPAVNDLKLLHSYMSNLPKIQRFRSLIMFIASADKKAVAKCLDELKAQSYISEEDFLILKNTYEL